MGLCRIISWNVEKTVKLSDSYRVFVKLGDGDYREMPECTSVSLPSYKYKEEIYHFGNNAKKFLLPDYSGLEDLSMEFLETYDPAEEKQVLRMRDMVDIFLNKLFDQERFAYKLTDYIPEISVSVMYNCSFDAPVLRYVFQRLKMTDYSKYDLDYSASSFAKWTLKFSYQTYYVEELNAMDFDMPPRPSQHEMAAERYAAEQAAMAALRPRRDVRTPVDDMAREQEYVARTKAERQEALDNIAALEDRLAQAQSAAGISMKLSNDASAANMEETERLSAELEKLHELERHRSDIDTEVMKARENLAEAEKEAAEDTWLHKMATDDYTGRMVKAARGRLKTAEENEKNRKEQLERDIARQEAVVESLRNENRATGHVAQELEADAADVASREAYLRERLNEELSRVDDINGRLRASREKTERFKGEYGESTGRRYEYTGSTEGAAEAAETAKHKAKVKEQYETIGLVRERSSENVLGEPDYNEFAVPEAVGGDHTPQVPHIGAYEASKAASEQHTRESEIAESIERSKFISKVKSEDAFGVRKRTEVENVLGEPERPELAELADIEKAGEFDNVLSTPGTAAERLEAEILPETTKKVFAEARRQEAVEIPDAQRVYGSRDFQDRVRDISMEMYDPAKNNAQIAYEKAQEQAMREYITGRLKINK